MSPGDARPIAGPPFPPRPLTNLHAFGRTTKAAPNRLTNDFAVEAYEHGIRSNCIEPHSAIATKGALTKGFEGVPIP